MNKINKEKIDSILETARYDHLRYKQNIKTDSYDAHPDLMCIYKPSADVGLVYCIERWDPKLKCEICSSEGAYYMANEKYKAGMCEVHLSNHLFEKVIKLQENHDYPDAEEVEVG